MNKKLTVGSLFSGIGGMDWGFEQAGMKIEYQVEINDYCNRVLKKHWPNVRRYKDVKEVGWNNIKPVDLICGGFPCQDISRARFGTRDGLAGERSGLWWEFNRIIDEFVPDWVVIENTPALLSSDNGRDFATIIFGLVDFGYGVCWRVLDSKHFGVGGTRRRLFIVAKFADIRSAREVLFKQNSISQVLSRKKKGRNTFPMCVGWDGGLSYERLRQCVVTKINPARNRKGNGIPRSLDRHKYRALGNAVVPQITEFIGKRIVKIDGECKQ